MIRLPPIPLDRMTPEQRAAYDAIVAHRARGAAVSGPGGIYQLRPAAADGAIGGPFDALVRSPEIGPALVALVQTLRYRSALPARLTELAILIIGREWTAQFEWYSHVRFAERAGVPPAVIEAIRRREPPPLDDPADAAVYAFATELHRTHEVGDATYQRALAVLGERGMVELTILLGFYVLVSMILNTFRVPVPGDRPPLDP